MVSVLLITHEKFGEALLEVGQHLLGEQAQIEALSLGPDDSREILDRALEDALVRLDKGSGVLIMVDLVGGTPFNASVFAMKHRSIDVITGLSLPLLVDALTMREAMGLDMLVAALKDRSGSYVQSASQLLRERGD